MYKIRPLLSPLLANFKAAYTLHRELSIDEAMVGFKGRLCFIQYLPQKPTKWGIKAYVLADSATGYVYSWRLYTGNLLLLIMYIIYYVVYCNIQERMSHSTWGEMATPTL